MGRRCCFLAETALGNLGVQGGEEQILQYGSVIGIAGLAVVVFQQAVDPRLDEQVAIDQSLFFHEPDEQLAGNQADQVFFRRQGCGLVGGERGLLDGASEPCGQLPVEPSIQFFGVQGVQPGGE